MILFIGRLFGLIIGVIAILQTLQDIQKHKVTIFPAAFWLFVWLIIIIFSADPALLDILIAKTGGKTGFGTIIGIGIVFSVFISYKNYQRTEALAAKINSLAKSLSKTNQ